MTSTTFFFVFIPILAIILLAVNLIFAPHNPYQEKNSAFECGFHSFLGQNRTQFSISFFIFALLFLLFDLEILLVYPYVVSAYTNNIYGLVIMLIFFLALTLGFAFELGKNALKIDSRQMVTLDNQNTKSIFSTLASIKSINNLMQIRKYMVEHILINFTLAKFAAALLTITMVALIKYSISGNFHINYSDFWNNIGIGLLG
jgi:NADH-ubiquinone oxidoreductase chain 3